MIIKDIEEIYRAVNLDMETRLGTAHLKIENLQRMENEFVAAMETRHREDVITVRAMFASLCESERDQIKDLQTQLGQVGESLREGT